MYGIQRIMRRVMILMRLKFFKLWTTTDRTDLTSMKLSLSKFIDLRCGKTDKIISQSFIARSRSSYLAHLKETVGSNEAIVLGDFAENYSSLIQDEIQCQCSIHRTVVYYVSNNVFPNSSL